MHLLVVIMLTLCCSDRHIDHFAEAGKYCHLRSNIAMFSGLLLTFTIHRNTGNCSY